MIVFNVRFLVWGVRIAEKHFRLRIIVRIVFKSINVTEFSAVISQKNRENVTETEPERIQFFFQVAYFAGGLGSHFAIQQ